MKMCEAKEWESPLFRLVETIFRSKARAGPELPRSKKENTAQVAERLVKPILEARGLTLWDVRFEMEGGSWYLRYFIDKDGGVNIGDCEYVSRAVDKLLDEADPIEQSYVLEVGSPGTERELVKDWHFERYIGSPVTVKLFSAANGSREHTGALLARTADGEITIETETGEKLSFLKAQTAAVRLFDDYDTEYGGLD
jgi:ribosome maturation factor RimP